MSEQYPGQLPKPTRRRFLQGLSGAAIAVAAITGGNDNSIFTAPSRKTVAVASNLQPPGYGTGIYGAGPYGSSQEQHTIFLPLG